MIYIPYSLYIYWLTSDPSPQHGDYKCHSKYAHITFIYLDFIYWLTPIQWIIKWYGIYVFNVSRNSCTVLYNDYLDLYSWPHKRVLFQSKYEYLLIISVLANVRWIIIVFIGLKTKRKYFIILFTICISPLKYIQIFMSFELSDFEIFELFICSNPLWNEEMTKTSFITFMPSAECLDTYFNF